MFVEDMFMAADYEPEASPTTEPEGPETGVEQGVVPLRSSGLTERGKEISKEISEQGTGEVRITPPAGVPQQNRRSGGEALSRLGGRFIQGSRLNTPAADLSPGNKLVGEINKSLLPELEKVMGTLKQGDQILSEKKAQYMVVFETFLKIAKNSLPGLESQVSSRANDPISLAQAFMKFYNGLSTKIETLHNRMPTKNIPFNETLLHNASKEIQMILDALQKKS